MAERLPEPLGTLAPVVGIERFSLGVIESVAGVAPVVKLQAACYERYGSAGWAVLERVVVAARAAGLFVLLDAKRGDISTSAEHYAEAAARLGADAITVNPYLGPSGIEPFLRRGLVVFALVRTSNPDSDQVQEAVLQDGSTVAHRVATMLDRLGDGAVGQRGLSALGAVVGATQSQAGAALREAMPAAVFLSPGIGAQGASTEDAARLCRPGRTGPGDAGLLPTASRSVLYPTAGGGADWKHAIGEAARAFALEAKSSIG